MKLGSRKLLPPSGARTSLNLSSHTLKEKTEVVKKLLVASLFLVVRPGAPSSFLFLVVRGAASLLLVAMPFAPSSDVLSKEREKETLKEMEKDETIKYS